MIPVSGFLFLGHYREFVKLDDCRKDVSAGMRWWEDWVVWWMWEEKEEVEMVEVEKKVEEMVDER